MLNVSRRVHCIANIIQQISFLIRCLFLHTYSHIHKDYCTLSHPDVPICIIQLTNLPPVHAHTHARTLNCSARIYLHTHERTQKHARKTNKLTTCTTIISISSDANSNQTLTMSTKQIISFSTAISHTNLKGNKNNDCLKSYYITSCSIFLLPHNS